MSDNRYFYDINSPNVFVFVGNKSNNASISRISGDTIFLGY